MKRGGSIVDPKRDGDWAAASVAIRNRTGIDVQRIECASHGHGNEGLAVCRPITAGSRVSGGVWREKEERRRNSARIENGRREDQARPGRTCGTCWASGAGVALLPEAGCTRRTSGSGYARCSGWAGWAGWASGARCQRPNPLGRLGLLRQSDLWGQVPFEAAPVGPSRACATGSGPVGTISAVSAGHARSSRASRLARWPRSRQSRRRRQSSDRTGRRRRNPSPPGGRSRVPEP